MAIDVQIKQKPCHVNYFTSKRVQDPVTEDCGLNRNDWNGDIGGVFGDLL